MNAHVAIIVWVTVWSIIGIFAHAKDKSRHRDNDTPIYYVLWFNVLGWTYFLVLLNFQLEKLSNLIQKRFFHKMKDDREKENE